MEMMMEPTSTQRTGWLVGLAAILVSLTCWSFAATSNESLSAKIVLTNEENGRVTKSSFQCEGKIHGYLVFSEPIQKGELQGIWKVPNGAVAEHSRIPIDFQKPGRRTAYIWLEFEEQGGGILGSVDDSSQKDPLYNGQWSLEVLFNETKVTQENFNVEC